MRQKNWATPSADIFLIEWASSRETLTSSPGWSALTWHWYYCSHRVLRGRAFAGGFLIDAWVKRLVEQSFLILGWVANWRPLEIFSHDWWPVARWRDLCHRLSK